MVVAVDGQARGFSCWFFGKGSDTGDMAADMSGKMFQLLVLWQGK